MSDAASPASSNSANQQASARQQARSNQATPAAEGVPRVNPLVYRFVVDVTYLPVILSGMHLDVHGREHVPPPGTPLVVAANHVSGLDPFLIARALPAGRSLQFMAKRELFIPVIGDIIRAGGSFAVDRDGSDVGAIRTSLRILAAGGTVGIFPQGTRGGAELHGGAALIAARGRAPILPAGISKDGRRWVVRFGEPIAARGGIKANTAELAERLRVLSQPIGTEV